MSGGGLFLQTQNHPLKGYFVLLRWMLPPPEPGPVDHCKPPSEPALPEKSGGPGGLGDRFCKRCPVVPRGSCLVPVVPCGADRFIGSDDDGVTRIVEGRFLNLQPDFYNNYYWKL
ncbi:hypothetical protein HanXRQr2_Chr13g0569281 [Helianthus annuus]|uniref:Uncharacterized protein n=1 Tax=Helianthus annuus TaxID=4232 RepID=A0A9K3EE48_HELAN|nr:hypothetical protein HanXRQr2_Chr13g0569281 [Helianthus annuus]KAJ0496332.1 hypothetical protein HanHA89_Chr13g0498481 [Helianthus annuus]